MTLNHITMQEVNDPVLQMSMYLGSLVCRYLVGHLKVKAKRYVHTFLGFFSACFVDSCTDVIRSPTLMYDKVNNFQDSGSVPTLKDDPRFPNGGPLSSSSGQNTVVREDEKKNPPQTSEKRAMAEGAKAVPLGLGLGVLERKVQHFCIHFFQKKTSSDKIVFQFTIPLFIAAVVGKLTIRTDISIAHKSGHIMWDGSAWERN